MKKIKEFFKLIFGIYESNRIESRVISDPIWNKTKGAWEYTIMPIGVWYVDYYFLWIKYKSKPSNITEFFPQGNPLKVIERKNESK